MSDCELKNGWQMARGVGESPPYGMQYLLGRASRDAGALQVRLSEDGQAKLGSPDAVLTLDETGFLKSAQSVGVALREKAATEERNRHRKMPEEWPVQRLSECPVK